MAISRIYYDKDTHQTGNISDLIKGKKLSRRFVDTPYVLRAEANSYCCIETIFLGRDARKDDSLDLRHMSQPLVFSTKTLRGICKGIRTFWSTYEQAKLGHEYFAKRQRAEEAQEIVARIREVEGLGFQLTDRHHDASMALQKLIVAGYEIEKQLCKLIEPMGASEIYDLTRAADYVPIKNREPIVLPADGYQSDIERFIHL
jgi:hypothetical protein